MEHPALLIIDMQNDFVREGAQARVAQAKSIMPKIRDVLAFFRNKNYPVIHVLRVHRSDGSDVEITRKEIFSPAPVCCSPVQQGAVRRSTELDPLPGRVHFIEKARMSAFIGTELDLMLRTLGITVLRE